MDLKAIYVKLGKSIKKYRERLNLTQESLADKAGISQDYLGKIEVNINNPGFATICKLANAMDIELKDLFTFD